jgi:hypothetical protein
MKTEPFAHRPLPEPQPQASSSSISLPPPQETVQLPNLLKNNLGDLLNPADPDAVTLLALLAMIDSGELPPASDNPMLATALQQLWARIGSSQPIPEQRGVSDSHQRQPSQDEDVVFLDKENVNPTAFRRRAEREREEAKLIGSSSVPPEVSPQRVGLSVRSNTMNDLPIPPVSRAGGSAAAGRKRTLSDADNSRRERQRRVSSGRDVQLLSHKSTIPDPYRHYSRVAEPATANSWISQSSPPRHNRDENSPSGSSRGRPIVIPDSPLRAAASSPVRKPRTMRKYVVPDWARTTTATKPRLSDNAQKALTDAQERKEQERWAKRARLHKSSASEPGSSQSSTSLPSSQESILPPSNSQSSTAPSSSQGSSLSDTPTASLPPAVAAADDFLAAALSSSIPSIPQSPPTRNTSLPFVPRTPKTPSRRSKVVDDSPEGVDDSLFTPLPKMPSIRNLPFGPAIDSPCGRPPKVSSFIRGGSLVPHSKDKSDNTDTDQGDEPSSTLPMASSDVEDNDEPERNPEQSSNAASPVVKQYWQGLPPSSPPAPSSPALLSSNLKPPHGVEQEEDDQLPLVSSDVEEDFTDIARGGSAGHTPLDASENGTSELDVFALFMNNFSSDEENLFTNGIGMEGGAEDEFDLNEILKGVMPWLGGASTSASNPENPEASNLDFSFDQLGTQSFDGPKSAQEMQTLFSGCVL